MWPRLIGGCGVAKRGCGVGKFSRTVTRDLISSGTLIYRDVITLGPFKQISQDKTSEKTSSRTGKQYKACGEPDFIL
jgi:hypothetical protein